MSFKLGIQMQRMMMVRLEVLLTMMIQMIQMMIGGLEVFLTKQKYKSMTRQTQVLPFLCSRHV